MNKDTKIYVAGHHGLVGSAIWSNLQSRGYTNLVGRSHKELDLLDGAAVKQFFDEEQPDAVVLAAAHVGGILANLQYRADFIYQNLQIQQNVIGESFRHNVRSFIRELCDARGKTILISSHILSEISLLADDIGIIDHGALLEEESLAELEQKSSKHIRFTLSDTAQAARILERNFHENHFSIQDDHNLRLYNLDLSVGKIVTAFVENGLEVSEAHTCEESLEDYFKRVTGGEGIA